MGCGATARQHRRTRSGRLAERLAADHLVAAGWTILATNVRVGRSELDLVAVDPGPPARLVVVEVRANRGPRFGSPEERVDSAKLRAVYRGALGLRVAGALPEHGRFPRLPLRVDLISVELVPTLGGAVPGTRLRHVRGVVA